MQNKPTVRPFLRPRIDDCPIRNRKITDRRGSEKRCNIVIHIRSAGHVPGLPWRNPPRDPPSPGQFRLLAVLRPRVRQSVPRHLLHQDERVVQHLQTLGRHIYNRLHNRSITRSPAVDGPPLLHRHKLGISTDQSVHNPRHLSRVLLGLLHLWLDLARATAQVTAKPAHHQRHRPAIRHLVL